MNDHPDCDACLLDCIDACALHPDVRGEPIRLEEAFDRFEKEAVRGVCNTGRYRMRYFTWGAGPPLVFLHGVSDNSRCFVQTISRLSAHFRCIAYDLPRGDGDRARTQHYTHAHLVADLFALLDHLDLRRTYLFASSFGSTVGLTAMHRQPARFPRAVLQGALAWRPLRPREKALVRILRPFPGRAGRLPLREKVLRKRNFGPFADRAPSVWRYFVENSGRTPIKAFAHQLLLLDGVDLRPLLPQIRQPILLLCGDQDPVIGRAEEEVLLSGLPNAGRVMIEGCGHVPPYTHPEVLAEVTRQFLTPPESGITPLAPCKFLLAARGPVAISPRRAAGPPDCGGTRSHRVTRGEESHALSSTGRLAVVAGRLRRPGAGVGGGAGRRRGNARL